VGLLPPGGKAAIDCFLAVPVGEQTGAAIVRAMIHTRRQRCARNAKRISVIWIGHSRYKGTFMCPS
jgi:RecA-family ATPase